MICPNCQDEQAGSEICIHCGVIFQKYFESLQELEKKTSNERDQKLKKGMIHNKKRDFFQFFNDDWKLVSNFSFVFLSALLVVDITPPQKKETVLNDWAF
jgi:hypothetical protein